MKHFALSAALCCLLLTQCKKADPDPVEQLPPATQTGANTFGCLLNGQPWTPQGNDGTANYSVAYDPTYKQGSLSVNTYRISNNGKEYQVVGFASDSFKTTGIYRFRQGGPHLAGVVIRNTNCVYYSTDAGVYCKGQFTVTRLNRTAGIVSGTFAFTLYKPGCDSVRITAGRFDRKL